MSHRRLTAYSYMLIASIIWGIGGPLIKRSLVEIPPLVFLTYRFAIITVISIFYITRFKPMLPKTPKDAVMAILSGFLGVPIGLMLSFFAFERTSAITVTTILSLSPIMMIFLGAVVLHDRITKTERLGIAITGLGSAIIILDPLISGTGQLDFSSLSGNIFAFINIFIGSFALLIDKLILRHRVNAFALSQIGFLIGMCTVGPLTLYLYDTDTLVRTLATASPLAHFGVWYMAIAGSLIAYGLTTKALQSIEMSETALFRYLTPVWAAPIAMLWLGETISLTFLAAAGIVMVGIAVAEYKRRKKKAAVHHHHRHLY